MRERERERERGERNIKRGESVSGRNRRIKTCRKIERERRQGYLVIGCGSFSFRFF
jgi:hypothetical protein